MVEFNEKLKEGVCVINVVEVNKINGLVSRVCMSLSSGKAKIFTREEEDKLSVSLGGLTSEQTAHLTHTILHIIQQAAYGMVRPASLGEHLRAEGMMEDRVECFVQSWNTHARAVVDKLRHNTLADKQLKDVGWSLNLETASSSLARQAYPVAHLDLKLESGIGVREEKTENILLQFNEEQLYSLYSQLEHIQNQLDTLH